MATEGLWGTRRLGKVAGPVGGADIGAAEGQKGLGGTMGAVAGGDGLSPSTLVGGDDSSTLHEHDDCSLLAVPGMDADSGVESPVGGSGELREMALDRKSV